MTKANMIDEIQEQEAALYCDLCAYQSIAAPVGVSHFEIVDWETSDRQNIAKFQAWNAIASLMETLGIPVDPTRQARVMAEEFNATLKLKRRVAEEE